MSITSAKAEIDASLVRHGWDLCVQSQVGISSLFEYMQAEYGNLQAAIHNKWPEDVQPTIIKTAAADSTTTTTTPVPKLSKEQVDAEIERLQQLRQTLL